MQFEGYLPFIDQREFVRSQTMANGGKKKNKKCGEESGRKVKDEKMELLSDVSETGNFCDGTDWNLLSDMQKRARVIANIAKTPRGQELMGTSSQACTKKEGESSEGKRAEDNKRRDSLGGSVSTSSNSSGTDCDDVLSEANKSAATSPHNETALDSPGSGRMHIADALSSIHQVAQSVVQAGTADALTTLSEFLPYTVASSKGKKMKAGTRKMAANKQTDVEMGKVAVPSSAPTPAPRKVVTPILNGRTSTPSAEQAAFKSISDCCPEEMPDANPTVVSKFSEELKTDENLIERSPSVSPREKKETQPYKAGRSPLIRSDFEGAVAKEQFFQDMLRQSFAQSIGDPILADNNNGFNVYGRPEYSVFERIAVEKVLDRPEAYLSTLKGDKVAPRVDMVAVHETHAKQEKSEGLWLKGERSVLKNIYDDIPKLLAKQKIPWIRDLLQLVFEGKPKKVYNRMRVMVSMLRHREGFDKCGDDVIYTHIATALLEAGTNSELGYSYVHVLAGQGNDQKMCGEDGHKRCMTLHLLLSPLSAESLQKALSLKAREWRNRTPVHFACATGQPCQLDALQKFRADCTNPDELGSTPVVYTLIRDNLFMLRMLSWYGADTMQTCDKLGHTALDWVNVTGKFPLGKTCLDFIHKRNAAFERILCKWMSEITNMVIVKKGLSEVHTIDCRQPSDQLIEKFPIKNEMVNIPHWIGHTNKIVHLKLRPTLSNEDRSSMFLVIIPFNYRTCDEQAPAEQPEVIRRSLFIEDDERIRPVQFIPSLPFINVRDPQSSRPPLQKALVPLLHQPNTGTFWAYKIPSDVFAHECIWVTLSLDLVKVDVALRENLRLLVQVVSLQPTTQRH